MVIINTCTVTHRADADLRKIIRRVRRENPQAKIITLGCYVNHYGKVSGADLSLPNARKMEVIETLGQAGEEEVKKWKSRGFLKVQEGCDLACTYCIIPKVRGKSRSLPLEEIRKEMEKFLLLGYREVVITGIHLESYGRDLGLKEGFLGLLRALEEYYPRVRFRISSLDPRYLNPSLLSYILSAPHIMPSYHLSLQHRSEKILRLMGRGRGRGFEELILRIKARRPEAGLGADFIVGFPGENEEDFRTLLNFAEKMPFTYFHVFTFSPREGTRAAEMKPKVPQRIVGERSRILRELSREKKSQFCSSMQGRELEATVIREGMALSENYLKLRFEGRHEPGERLVFKIEDCLGEELWGIPLGGG